MSKLGKNLTPTKFGVTENPNTQVNEFGQVYNTDNDQSAGDVPTPHSTDRLHARSDVDSNSKAQHHTLGNGANQSSPGDHIHDGISSKKIGPVQQNTIKPDSADPSTWYQEEPIPEWTIPASYTLADVVDLMHKFVNFREV